ncbi:unnamed protein product, partial [Linum tenue]
AKRKPAAAPPAPEPTTGVWFRNWIGRVCFEPCKLLKNGDVWDLEGRLGSVVFKLDKTPWQHRQTAMNCLRHEAVAGRSLWSPIHNNLLGIAFQGSYHMKACTF